MIVVGRQVMDWVSTRMDGIFAEINCQAIGLESNGKIQAGVVFENWNGSSIVAHMAAERLSRQFLWAVSDFAFNQCGAIKIIAPIAGTNESMIRLIEHMGFILEGCIRDGCPGGHMLLYTLRKQYCRFLEGKYLGQAITATVA
jgi:RimJ/RimL family protein N-acetyltransferase